MLELNQICKDYQTGEIVTHALKDVSVKFRNSEFVSILGPSGCGKTTLLNIIGGLDRYTSGDLVIDGISTKEYKDKDWDTYRNHTIGFVFQNYNLIMHINVESNVELALTLSGISEKERKARTHEVLERVGLLDKAKSLPNQLSGGQMQRVAIARALINNPDILLADEPTGALDSETSVQIMQLLKEIGNEKLVIMVTHNPELAENYSTRIINIKDGVIVSDTNPVTEEVVATTSDLNGAKKKSMSFLTALKLSGNNLRTKLTRTILVAIAGSIGIIGIALILSMSNGFQTFIDTTEENALAEYPIEISESSTDMSVLSTIVQRSMDAKTYDDGKIHVNNILSDSAKIIMESSTQNDLTSFKTYLESHKDINNYVLDIKYRYPSKFYIYTNELDELNTYNHKLTYPLQGISFGNWMELIDNNEHLEKKYEMVNGTWPKEANEIVVFLDANGQISDMVLYMLGLRDAAEIAELMLGHDVEVEDRVYEYSDIFGIDLKYLVNSDYFYQTEESGEYYQLVKYNTNVPKEMSIIHGIVDKTDRHLKIVGIAKPKDQNSMTSYLGGIGYTNKLNENIININNNAPATLKQLADPEKSIFSGNTLEEDGLTLEGMYKQLGYCDLDKPSSILIYPKSFDHKKKVIEYIDKYNAGVPEEQKIKYSDDVAVMISSVDNILNAVTYVLIAFVSVSLIVSSIMIGVITYISVLERTKEIGVLRSIGASKKDIRRVFNAETLIIGFASGIIGVAVSLLLLIPINLIIKHLTNIPNMGIMPWQGGIILVLISMGLTLIAGLIPSGFAAKRDPVVALRSE